MKKLFLNLMTANFSGTLLSLVVFLINTYRLPLQEYFLYSYINSSLIIAGLLVLFGTDNLALASYDRFPPGRVFASVRRIKFKMLFAGLLLFLTAFAYFRYTHPGYSFPAVGICFLLSVPFLLSFYYTHTHAYIQRGVYARFVKTAVLIKCICLIPIAVAAYFQRFLLFTTLAANSVALLLPALTFNAKPAPDPAAAPSETPLFSPLRLIENFVINSYPILYINAAFFLFGSAGDDFSKHKIIVYTSRIFIVLGGIAASVVSVMVSSHLAPLTSFTRRLGNRFYFFVLLLLAPAVFLYGADPVEPFRFIAWNVFELTVLTAFFVVFFVSAFNPHHTLFVPVFALATLCFFFAVKLQAPSLPLLMFERSVFVVFLTALGAFFCKKATVYHEKTLVG